MYLAALDYSRKQMAYIGTEFMEFSLFSPHISRHHLCHQSSMLPCILTYHIQIKFQHPR